MSVKEWFPVNANRKFEWEHKMDQGPVVRKLISANPGLKVNQCFNTLVQMCFPCLIQSLYSFRSAKIKNVTKIFLQK